ncbi:MAG TPA: sensor histidine kinase [Pirellulaceae bacterium]|jgi:signal transduction histidine kinase
MPTDLPSDPETLRAECRRLSDALTLAERDRQLLGYEIHDDVVQDLTAAIMLLEAAGREAQFATAECQQSYARGLRLLQDAIASARRLIPGVIVPAWKGVSFCAALSQLIEKFRGEHLLPVVLNCNVPDPKLPGSMQHLLLRIAQESLHNACKHAQATQVEVTLTKNDDQLELSITDDGIGFEPSRVAADHFGLEGIRARSQVLGASLLFDTAPNHGTRVVVRFQPPVAT